MNKAYERINWENYPSENTALNEANLNKMDAALNEVDNRVVAHETTKLDVATANSMVRNISFNERTGIFTVTYLNGSTKELDTKLEKIATNFVYDEERQKLILTLIDGTTQEIDMSALITQYEFENSAYIKWTVVSGKVKAEIINGSITADKLQPNFLADVTLQANSAKTSEQNAKVSEENAKQSEINAKNYADSAEPVASTANGLNPTLANSTAAPFIMFKGKGATIQDGTPTPDNEVPIYGAGESGSLSVKSTGKNLFDLANAEWTKYNSASVITVEENKLTITGSWFCYTIVDVEPNTDYCISANIAGEGQNGSIAVYGWDKTTGTSTGQIKDIAKNDITFNTGNNHSIRLNFYASISDTSATATWENIQLEKGTKKTDFESYTGTQADIPVNAPLYECDYIRYNMDGSGEESRKQLEVVFDGSDDEGWVRNALNTGENPYYYIIVGNYGDVVQTSVKCTHLMQAGISNANTLEGINVINSTTYGNARLIMRPSIDVCTDEATFIAWLAENKPKVVYELAEPTVTPLTAGQIAEFEKLRTFDGTTHITCEAESEVQYFCDSVSGKAVASVVSKVERELSDFDIALARTGATATGAYNRTKYGKGIISDFDYETGEVMGTGSDDLSVVDALAHLEGAVIDIMNGVIANKAKIDALTS